jgi:hypothetical protein
MARTGRKAKVTTAKAAASRKIKKSTNTKLNPSTTSGKGNTEQGIAKDAFKLKELISGGSVDVIKDLESRLAAGDAETVKFLKSMYSITKMKECLLCGKKCPTGTSAKQCTVL